MNKERKEFLKSAALLVVPVAMQNLITTAINSLDVIMLGRVNEIVLAGASLGNQVYFNMSLFLFGITSGAAVLIAQYWGKKDLDSIKAIFGLGMKLGIAVSSLFALSAFFIPELLMRIFTDDTEIIRQGEIYLRIVCFSYPFTAVNMIYLNTMRSMEKVKIATLAYSVSFFVNLIANGVLIFGLLGFPALGTAGAAWGTVIARFSESLVILFYDRKINRTLKFSIKFLVSKNGLLTRDFWKYALPVIINELSWGTGISMITGILGRLGSSVVAANAVAQVARQLSMIIGFGVAAAAAIEIGKKIGEGNREGAKDLGRRYAVLSVITGFIGAAVILIALPVMLKFLVLTPDAAKYLKMMMLVMSYFVIGQSINSCFVVGIFRAGGDTRFGLFFDLTFMWGIAILGGWIAAFVFHAPVTVVYMILLSDEVLKMPVAYGRYKSYKWLKNVTR